MGSFQSEIGLSSMRGTVGYGQLRVEVRTCSAANGTARGSPKSLKASPAVLRNPAAFSDTNARAKASKI